MKYRYEYSSSELDLFLLKASSQIKRYESILGLWGVGIVGIVIGATTVKDNRQKTSMWIGRSSVASCTPKRITKSDSY